MAEPFKFDTLDTSYVSLVALIRYLRANQFTGRLHVALEQYESDVFLYGAEPPSVWENDHAAGRESRGEEALQRLLVRAREPGGIITVYQGAQEPEAVVPHASAASASEVPIVDNETVGEGSELSNAVAVSTEVINAVERAVVSAGISFADQLHHARIDVGDDYVFLDPTVGGFEYTDSKVTLQTMPSVSVYVQGIVEVLKRVVDRVSDRQGETYIRERVAVELAMAARRVPDALEQFSAQLDRIAGTRVL